MELPKEYFQDSEKIWRAINIRLPESKEIKGTIAFLFGGYKEEPKDMDKIVAGSKGVNTIGRAPNSNEIKVIEQLVERKWRVLLFDDMQFATPDGTVHNEMWIVNDANLNYTTSTMNTNGSLNNNQIIDANKLVNKTANYFIGFHRDEDPSQWLKAFERSLTDFLPLLPTGDFKMRIIDFVIKIIGGAVTFGLIAIALRRRFERRYRH